MRIQVAVAQTWLSNENTDPLLQQLLARVLQTLPTLLDRPPPLEHVLYFPVNLIYPLNEPVACLQVARHAFQVSANVRFLAMGYGAVNEREPIIELLRCLDLLLWMKRM